MILYALFSCILLILLLIYVYTIWHFARGWDKVAVFEPEPIKAPVKLSVIIAARNEEDRIGRCIESILAQDYPREFLELIIIDDHSEDGTADLVRRFPSVKLIVLNEGSLLNSYKKKAIAEGISQASGELIVTTDADCEMGPEWISMIVGYYQKTGAKLISAPVAFYEEKNWFERVQTIEFLYLVGSGAASIGNKIPFSCNGANLAYSRAVFIELGGFSGIDHLASGDDELFMHKVHQRYPDGIGFLKNEKAIVYTHAKPNLQKFLQQRKRWASKSIKYQSKTIVVTVVAVWAFNLLLTLGLLSLVFTRSIADVLLFTLGIKLVTDFVFMYKTTSFFKRAALLRYFLVVQVLYMLYIVFIGIYGNTGKYYWKGRHVN